jgi:hypothetical protein
VFLSFFLSSVDKTTFTGGSWNDNYNDAG